MNTRITLALAAALVLLPVAAAHAHAHAHAQAQADTASIWSLQDENAAIALQPHRDHFYTNGFRLSWTSPTTMVPDVLVNFGHDLWGDGQTRIGIALSQRIDTPMDPHTTVPTPNCQPYAGLLTGDVSLLSDTPTTRSMLTLTLGVAGPLAGGEIVQNDFHGLIGRPKVAGWNNQIPNTAVFEVTHERIWRQSLGTIAGMETDVLPSLTIGVGDLRDYAQAGVTVRLGEGLDADFGVPRLRPGLNGGDAYATKSSPSWYVFAGADAQVVGYDLLLQAAPFRSGIHATPIWDVAELQAGVAVIVGGTRLTLAYVAQTPEFDGQPGGMHQFASISVSVRF
jgi:lipid A 3-O-deacylase